MDEDTDHPGTVSGHAIYLENGGNVWLGTDRTECACGRDCGPTNRVTFTNKDGKETHLGLSDQAIEALSKLYQSREGKQITEVLLRAVVEYTKKRPGTEKLEKLAWTVVDGAD